MDVEKVCMGILLASILFIAGLVVWDLVGDKFKKSEEKKEETLVVKEGDKVTVDYIGRFPNGEVFDTSIRAIADNPLIPKSPGFTPQSTYQPLEFVVGSGRMIKGFEDGVIGMRVGETRNITVPPEEGYGPADPNLIMWIPETEFVPPLLGVAMQGCENRGRPRDLPKHTQSGGKIQGVPLELHCRGHISGAKQDSCKALHLRDRGLY